MNKRLRRLMAWVSPASAGLIDVGTDHGYLPAELIKSGYQGRVYASDINALPLRKARETASEAGCEDRIGFLLCDGLRLCPADRIDTIVVAGMSGETICRILDEAEWCLSSRYTLLLQPMSHQEVLRYWLIHNGFFLDDEALVQENGRIYQLLRAVFTGENSSLSDAELYLGAKTHFFSDPLYRLVLERQIGLFADSLHGLESVKDRESIYRFRSKIYQELIQLREELNGNGI